MLLPRAIMVATPEAGALLDGNWAAHSPTDLANGLAAAAGPPASRGHAAGPGRTSRHRLTSAPETVQARPVASVPAAARPPVAGSWAAPAPGLPTGDKGSYLGMPRRVRGENLSPQLRARHGEQTPGSPVESAGPAARSPEEAGSLFSALQSGWQRGRDDELDYRGIGLGDWPDRAPGLSGAEARPNDYEE